MISDIVQRTIQNAVSSASLNSALNEHVGPWSVAQINRRTNQGRFLGGRLSSMGYSSTPIPLWFLGRSESTESGYRVRYTDGGFRTTVNLPEQSVQWGRNPWGSKSTPWLKGGYREFKQASGRSVSRVNLQMSGQMLNSLRYNVHPFTDGARLSVTVGPDQQDKAGWTNAKRRWLDLSESEVDRALSIVADIIHDRF